MQDKATVWRLERARFECLCDMLFTPGGKGRICCGARGRYGRKQIKVGDPVYIATRLGAWDGGVAHLCSECYANLAHPAIAIVEGGNSQANRIRSGLRLPH
jgi:hypothetical protein